MIRYLTALAMVAPLLAHGAPPPRAVSFVACPVAQDTGPHTDVCFFAEHRGERFALTNPPDFGMPQLGHRVLVEGIVNPEAPRECGGIVLEGRVSVLVELSPECNRIMPFAGDGMPAPSAARFAEKVGEVALDPQRSLQAIPLPPLPPADVARGVTETIYYPFDSDRSSGPDAQRLVELARLAQADPDEGVRVAAFRGGTLLDDGARMIEDASMARQRAEKVAGILVGLGVPAESVSTRWSDSPQGLEGREDWRARRVEVTVAPPDAEPDADIGAAGDARSAELLRRHRMPDTPGTGRYPAVKEQDAALPDHVIYRPRDLRTVDDHGLGIYVFGNGGCTDDGASARLHLLDVASHGYLVIAPGTILSGPGVPKPPLGTRSPRAPRGEPVRIPPPATRATALTEAMDWALAAGADPSSPYFGKIASGAVAVSGWSCGGLQALQVAGDPRVATVVIMNSGIFADGSNPIEGMTVSKLLLDDLHTPTLYVLGGEEDVAYPNGMDDFRRIDHVPVMVASLDVGHGGTFWEPDGGRAARLVVDWLGWQLRGDESAALRFLGPDCGLCRDPQWSVRTKRID